MNQKIFEISLRSARQKPYELMTLLPGESVAHIVIINDHRAIVVVNQPEEGVNA